MNTSVFASKAFSITDVRYNIYSYIPLDYAKLEHAKLFRDVIKQIHTYFQKKVICSGLSQGCKKVCDDFETPCVMCYYYGFYDPDGVCLYHYGQSPSTYISYVYYKKLMSMYQILNPNTNYFLLDISNYEDYRKQRDELEEERKEMDFYY